MRNETTFRIVDGRPEIETDDGSVYGHELIGYVAPDPGVFYDPSHYRRFTMHDANFIVESGAGVELVMDDEFTSPGDYYSIGLYEGEPKPKMHRGKLVIYIKQKP